MAVAFRRHTLLPLDDCLYALQASIPHLTRSALHPCFQRHGVDRLPEIDSGKSAKKAFKPDPIGFFHIDIVEAYETNRQLHEHLGSFLTPTTSQDASRPCAPSHPTKPSAKHGWPSQSASDAIPPTRPRD